MASLAVDDAEIAALYAEFSFLDSKITSGTATKSDKKTRDAAAARLIKINDLLTTTPPDWSSLPEQTATIWIPDLPKTMEDLREQRAPVEASGTKIIKIAKYPFAKGGVRLAYHAVIKQTNGSWKK